MSETLRLSDNPEIWRLRGKILNLRAKTQQSRMGRIAIRQERLDREHAALISRWRQLVDDARIASEMGDLAAQRRVAARIAAFNQSFGTFETKVDAMLQEVEALGFRTG